MSFAWIYCILRHHVLNIIILTFVCLLFTPLCSIGHLQNLFLRIVIFLFIWFRMYLNILIKEIFKTFHTWSDCQDAWVWSLTILISCSEFWLWSLMFVDVYCSNWGLPVSFGTFSIPIIWYSDLFKFTERFSMRTAVVWLRNISVAVDKII